MGAMTTLARTKFRDITLAIVILVAATCVPFTGGALAGKVQVSGTHNEADIKSHCDAAKGVYFTNDSGTYGCDAPGGAIKCTSGKCEGTCQSCGAAIAHGKGGVLGVLSGTTLKAATNATTKKTTKPVTVKRPVEQRNSGATSNTDVHHGKK